MSIEQRETLDAILRQGALPADSDVSEQRRLLKELLSAQPLPADVTVTPGALGGVRTAEITVDGIEPRHIVMYFHGGVYVLGDAFLAADLASQVGRRTSAKVISVDYRLAPEHPYPAAVDDALAAYEALLRRAAPPLRTSPSRENPPAADSPSRPWSTLAITGFPCLPRPSSCHRMSTSRWRGPRWKPSARPTRCSARRHCAPGSPTTRQAKMPGSASISPIFADLSGLPPLIIQAGSHEVLLDDAIRLAGVAASADVEITLDITPGVPHVFQAYHPILDEAVEALDRAGQFLSAHLAGSPTLEARIA